MQLLRQRIGRASSDLPLMQNRDAKRVMAYLCEAYMCAEPTSEPERLRALLGIARQG